MFLNLKSALKESDISLKAYSQLLGISEKSLQNKLNETTEFTLREVEKTLGLLPKYRPEYLFRRE